MKTFFKIVLLLCAPPIGLAWILFEWLFKLGLGDEERAREAERDAILKRATIALEKNAAEEVPFWRANK